MHNKIMKGGSNHFLRHIHGDREEWLRILLADKEV